MGQLESWDNHRKHPWIFCLRIPLIKHGWLENPSFFLRLKPPFRNLEGNSQPQLMTGDPLQDKEHFKNKQLETNAMQPLKFVV